MPSLIYIRHFYWHPISFLKLFWKEKKKESHSSSGGFKRSQVFLKKYYPTVVLKRTRHRIIECWIENTRVEIFSKTRRAWTLLFETGTYLYFLFIYFFCSRMFLVWTFFGNVSCGNGNQTPPSTAEKKWLKR